MKINFLNPKASLLLILTALVLTVSAVTLPRFDIEAQATDVMWGPDAKPLTMIYAPYTYSVAKSNNGYFITWYGYVDGDYFLMLQKFNLDGEPLWGDTAIEVPTWNNSFTGEPYNAPRVIAEPDGGAIVSWNNSPPNSSLHMFVQKYNASGQRLWSEFGVGVSQDFEQNTQKFPQLYSDGAGGAVIAWVESSTGCGVYTQRINSSGVRTQGNSGQLLDNVCSNTYTAGVSLPNGGGIIGWNDNSTGTFYAQKVNPNGSVAWENPVPMVASGVNPADPGKPQMVSDGSGGAYLFVGTNSGHRLARVTSAGEAPWNAAGLSYDSALLDRLARGSGPMASPIMTDASGNLVLYGYASDSRLVFQKFSPAGVVSPAVAVTYTRQSAGNMLVGLPRSNGDMLFSTYTWGYPELILLDSTGAKVWSTETAYSNNGAMNGPESGILDFGPDGVVIVAYGNGNLLKMQRVQINYQGENLDSGLGVEDIYGANVELGMSNGVKSGDAMVLKSNATGSTIARFNINTMSDLDMSTVSGGTNPIQGKAFVSGLQSLPGVSGIPILYVQVPMGSTTDGIMLCPDTNSLASLSVDCINGVPFKDGQTLGIDGRSVTANIITIEGDEYWQLTNAGDMGAIMMSIPVNPPPDTALTPGGNNNGGNSSGSNGGNGGAMGGFAYTPDGTPVGGEVDPSETDVPESFPTSYPGEDDPDLVAPIIPTQPTSGDAEVEAGDNTISNIALIAFVLVAVGGGLVFILSRNKLNSARN